MDTLPSTGSYLASHPQHVLYVGLSGALAVALGAFGAHALGETLEPDRLVVFRTAVQYHFIHTLVLLLVLALPYSTKRKYACWAFGLGIAVFCGSLYILATRGLLGIEGATWLGAVTPLGGLGFITGWLLLAFSGAGGTTAT